MLLFRNLRYWRTSLFTKITWLAIICSLMMFIIIAVFVTELFDDLHHHHHAAHDHAARTVARRVFVNPTAARIDNIAEQYGLELRYEGPHLAYASIPDLPRFDEIYPLRRTRGGMLLARTADGRLVKIHRRNGARLMIMWPQQEDRDSLWNTADDLLALLAAALLLLWLGSYFYQRRLLKPLVQLRQDMDAVGRGEWRQTPVAGNDEIGELTAGFNRMQTQLRTAAQTRERFLADASHELRSPLTRLRLAAEMVNDNALQRRLIKDIKELDALTTDIMEKTRLENFRPTLKKKTVAAAQVLVSLREKYPDVHFAAPATAAINADTDALTRALRNLLDNAVKFCRSEVRAVCEDADGGVCFRVCNDGSSVAAADLPHLFEPFYRTDTSRTRETGGFGLGLSIVKAAVEAHDGRVLAENRAGGGLQVEIWLPAEAPATTAPQARQL